MLCGPRTISMRSMLSTVSVPKSKLRDGSAGLFSGMPSSKTLVWFEFAPRMNTDVMLPGFACWTTSSPTTPRSTPGTDDWPLCRICSAVMTVTELPLSRSSVSVRDGVTTRLVRQRRRRERSRAAGNNYIGKRRERIVIHERQPFNLRWLDRLLSPDRRNSNASDDAQRAKHETRMRTHFLRPWKRASSCSGPDILARDQPTCRPSRSRRDQWPPWRSSPLQSRDGGSFALHFPEIRYLCGADPT